MGLAGEKYIAAVAVSNTSLYFDRRYKYLVPSELEESVRPGCRVVVPFGKGNRKRIGVVVRLDLAAELPPEENVSAFKPIRSVVDKEPPLNSEMLELMMWLRETTLCTYFEAFRALIPIGLNVDYSERYVSAEGELPSEDILSDSAKKVWKSFCEEVSTIENAKGTDIEELVDKGFLVENDFVKRRKKDDTIKMLRLSEEYLAESSSFSVSEKGKAVVELLEGCGAASVKEISYICGVSASVISTLKKNHIVEAFENEYISDPVVDITENVSDIVLSDEQQKAFDGISALIDEGKPQAALLYGVTGSGKTSVFIKLIQ